ncbi:TM1812 family CRISPR-associated protein [Oceanithermus sp.]
MREGGKYILGALGLPRKTSSGELRYLETRYQLNFGGEKKRSSATGLTMRALVEFFPDYSPVFLTTSEAKKRGWGMVVEELGGNPENIDIPEGKSEEEIWDTVRIIINKLPRDADFIIDITNGYRALPLIALLSALLVENMGEISIRHVFYGAFEAKSNNITPIFDLTPLLNIQKWSRALSDLRRFSQTEPIVELLKTVYEPAYRDKSTGLQQPHNLSKLASRLERLGKALRTVRTKQAADLALEVREVLEDAERELEYFPELQAVAPFLQPSFSELAELVPDDYGSFEGEGGFRAMARLIRYYLRTQAYPEAVTLAREALVSMCVAKGGGNLFHKPDRERAEDALNPEADYTGPKMCRQGEIQKVWHQLRELRNDINHAAFRSNSMGASKIAERANSLCGAAARLLEEYVSDPNEPNG